MRIPTVNLFNCVLLLVFLAVLVVGGGCRSNDTGRNTVNICGYSPPPDGPPTGTAEIDALGTSTASVAVIIVTGAADQNAPKAVSDLLNPAASVAAAPASTAGDVAQSREPDPAADSPPMTAATTGEPVAVADSTTAAGTSDPKIE